jgi:stage V sporulation protein G
MEITEVKVFPVAEDKLKAFVSITFDRCFVVSDIKIIQGGNGLFVSMPSKKRKNGSFRDIAHPLDNETRRRIEEQIIREYREVISHAGGDASAPLRELGQAGSFGAEGDDIAARRISARPYAPRPFDQP